MVFVFHTWVTFMPISLIDTLHSRPRLWELKYMCNSCQTVSKQLLHFCQSALCLFTVVKRNHYNHHTCHPALSLKNGWVRICLCSAAAMASCSCHSQSGLHKDRALTKKKIYNFYCKWEIPFFVWPFSPFLFNDSGPSLFKNRTNLSDRKS